MAHRSYSEKALPPATRETRSCVRHCTPGQWVIPIIRSAQRKSAFAWCGAGSNDAGRSPLPAEVEVR